MVYPPQYRANEATFISRFGITKYTPYLTLSIVNTFAENWPCCDEITVYCDKVPSSCWATHDIDFKNMSANTTKIYGMLSVYFPYASYALC